MGTSLGNKAYYKLTTDWNSVHLVAPVPCTLSIPFDNPEWYSHVKLFWLWACGDLLRRRLGSGDYIDVSVGQGNNRRWIIVVFIILWAQYGNSSCWQSLKA